MKEIKRILITGGTGLTGKAISDELLKNDYEVAVLSRQNSGMNFPSFLWNPEKEYIDPEAIIFADAIIHLAGENISSSRWTAAQKKKIQDSRIRSTELLYAAIAASDNKPKKLISASASGYYGNETSPQIYVESDPPGNDFLSKTVNEWEKKVSEIEELGVMVNKIRIGMVLSAKGGALPKLITPVNLGLGAALGSGKQWMPWISIEDLARMFLFLIENNLPSQVYNGLAPQHISNTDFMRTLAKVLGKPHFLPNIPAFLMKVILGEMASIVLNGSRISSEKIQKEGFRFSDTKLKETLKKLIIQ